MSPLQRHPLYAYLPVKDVARARTFYEGKIGLVPKEQANGGITYTFAGGTACFLYPTPNAGTNQASQAFWQVDDVERLVTELRERGVEFERYDDAPGQRSLDGLVVEDGGAKAAWFKDPDGNILALIQQVG